MRREMREIGLVMSVIALASSCDCRGRNGIGQNLAEIGIVWTDATGSQRVNRDATYDFGAAFVGESLTGQIVVRNLGGAPLRLVRLEQTDGAPATVGDVKKDNAYFDVRFSPGVTVDASATVTIDMSFTPHVGVKRPTAKLLLTTEGTRAEDSTAVITLIGEGEGANCEIPRTLDFGDVPTGEGFKLGIKLENGASIESKASVGAISGIDAPSFSINPTGDLTVGPRSTRIVEVTFSPSELRAYEAKTVIKAGAECESYEVTIKGHGVDTVLSWTPDTLSYGFVSPNVAVPRQVTFKNHSNAPIKLTQVKTNFIDFIYDAPMGEAADTFTIAGGGTSNLVVSCRPSSFGPRKPSDTQAAELTFETGLKREPRGKIILECVGGGPRIRVTPRPNLNFGKVGFFPNATTYSVTRKVTVQNVGTKPVNDPDGAGNLYLGPAPGDPRLVVLTPGNSNTSADEFSVAPQGYNLQTGLIAEAGKNMADLVVMLTPKSVGTKIAELTILSNDALEPEITLKITAEVQKLPPCNLFVSTTTLDFGLVTPPGYRDLPLTIKNLGSNSNETCTLSGLELAPGSDAAFSIVGGNIDERVLKPGESLNLVVRVWPMGAVPAQTQTLVGQVKWNVVDPTTPQRTVRVQAAVGPSCLTVAPESYDFGKVKKTCNTRPREFIVYNTCPNDVFVKGISLSSAAGQPAGGANCPGTSACPEFSMVAAPVIPNGGLRLAPGATTKFSTKYRPLDDGKDNGAVSIEAIQSGQFVTYLVSLSGDGDSNGSLTETFEQAMNPEADVLLVIDNSASMEAEQQNLASNFASFIQYAQSTNIDWHIGVTTTDVGCLPIIGCQQGGYLRGDDLRTNPNGNPKVLTRTTPNFAQKFAEKVKVGTNGSATEQHFAAAVKALTAPVVTNENAGFLRYDANLAIVVVTDAGDSSPDTYDQYLDRLRSIKGYQRGNLFSFSVIGPFHSSPPNGCEYDPEHNASSLKRAAVDTSGVFAEICDTDWSTKLKELGKTAFGFRTTFFLGSEPDLTQGRVLDVKIDGTPVPAANYTYRPATFALEFTQATTPKPGQKLTVSYTRACF